MTSSTGRAFLLVGVAIALFAISIIVLMRLLPGPHTERDYFIIGCMSTLISLFALFLIVIKTWLGPSNPLLKRRKR